MLMIKPWHFDFNPVSETFNKFPIWVRFPNLPLHLWHDSLLEEGGDALGDFLMVDDESSGILHSTYARILVEINVSKGLPAEVLLKSSKGSWVQSLDYEGIPFRCRRCFNTGHSAAHCGFEKKTKTTTWWKGASQQHYTVEKKADQNKSFSDVVASESLGLGTPPPIVSSGRDTRVSPFESKSATSGACASASLSGGSSVKSLSTQRNQDESPKSFAIGFHTHESCELVWDGKAAQVEEGWITIKGKKVKSSKPSFDMILRSHKKSVNCKS